MAEGITTRLQQEVSQQQKKLERLEGKMEEGFSRLRRDMEQKDTDVKRMFEHAQNRGPEYRKGRGGIT